MNTSRLAGRTALITGAGAGIGAAAAAIFSREGAAVLMVDANTQALESTRALIEKTQPDARLACVAADVADEAAALAAVAQCIALWGGLDILVNNAGFADYARVDQMALHTFDRTFDHYLRVPFRLAQAAIPHMLQAGAGWIVNIGSITAYPPVRPYLDYAKAGGDSVYAASKAALHRLTQGMAAELVDSNIAVNVVGPSTAIRTPGADALIPADYPCEDPAYLAQTVLEMCHLPAAERTGLVAFSMHFPHAMGFPVRTLDGTGELPPAELPLYSHPATSLDGL